MRSINFPNDEASDFLLSLNPHDQVGLILSLPVGERRIWMRLLPPDDAADVIQKAPTESQGELLGWLDGPTRREVKALLAYVEDEAGGRMNPRFARMRPEMSVDEAIAYLRRQTAQSRRSTTPTYSTPTSTCSAS
jgi:magnesium transporter